MPTESGGNPNAITLTDSNAAAGDPSRGLLQPIGSTFAAFAGPFSGRSIYDPMANIYAALNYAMHRYGPTLMSGGAGVGSGHGYAAGTGWASPGWALVGESGPELLRLRGGGQITPIGKGGRKTPTESVNFSNVTGRLDALLSAISALIGVTAQSADDTGYAVAAALGGAARDASNRAMWGAR